MFVIEVEKRYKIDNADKLIKLAKKTKEKTHYLDLVFSKDGKDTFQNWGYVIRIRQKQKDIKVQMKIKQENGWEEIEFNAKSIDEVKRFFGLIGYEVGLTIEKHRTRYEFEGFKLDVDDVVGLGKFIEVSIETDKPVKKAEQRIKELAQRFNLGKEQPLYGTMIRNKS